jgi:hypothetical protein
VNPYVFIVGCPRSGTTLLQRMVDAHSEIAITRQSRFIPNYYEKRKGLTPEGLVTPGLVDRLVEERRFKNLEIGREDLESLAGSGEPVPYSRFVTGIFDHYGKVQSKRLVGDKTPRYVRSIPTLHKLWPETRFVHIVRDGRDVCLSMMNWKKADSSAGQFSAWKEDRVSTGALWWELNVRLGRQDGGSLPPELYHEVHYEELVSEPEEACANLCDFLGLSYDDAMLRFHEGREKSDPDLDAKKGWRPLTPGLRKWSEQMSVEDLRRFEAAAGDLLDELGYPRAVPDPPQEALAWAARIRESFTGDVPSSGDRLPVGWKT